MVEVDRLWSVRVMLWADRWRWVVFCGLGAMLLGLWDTSWRITAESARLAWVAQGWVETGSWMDPDGHHAALSPGMLRLYGWMMVCLGDAWVGGVNAVVMMGAGLGLWVTYHVMRRAGRMGVGLQGLGLEGFADGDGLSDLVKRVGRGQAVIVTGLLGLSLQWAESAVRPLTDGLFLGGVMLVWLGVEVVIEGWSRRAVRERRRRLRDQRLSGGAASAEPVTLVGRLRRAGLGWWLIKGLGLIGVGLAWASLWRSVWVVLVAAVVLGLGVELTRAVFWRAPPREGLGVGRRLRAGVLWGGLGLLVLAGAAWAYRRWVVGMDPALGWGPDQRVFWESLQQVDMRLGANVAALLGEAATGGVFGLRLGVLAWVLGPVTLGFAVVWAWRSRPMWSCWVGLLVVQWLIVQPRDRYVLACLPIVAWAWWRAAVVLERGVRAWVSRRSTGGEGRSGAWGGAIVFGFLGLWLVVNAVCLSRVLVEQRSGDGWSAYQGGRYAAVQALAETAARTTPEDAVLIGSRGLPAMELGYLAGRRVVQELKEEVVFGPDDGQGVTLPGASAYYVVEPIGERTAAELTRRGWRLGDRLDDGGDGLGLRRVWRD
ncbi:MAG: hypothetical protein AAGI68_07805 [Planctomycetota bacterium]